MTPCSVLREAQGGEGFFQEFHAFQRSKTMQQMRGQRSQPIVVESLDYLDDLHRREVIPIGQDLHPVVRRCRQDVLHGSTEQIVYQLIHRLRIVIRHKTTLRQTSRGSPDHSALVGVMRPSS